MQKKKKKEDSTGMINPYGVHFQSILTKTVTTKTQMCDVTDQM